MLAAEPHSRGSSCSHSRMWHHRPACDLTYKEQPTLRFLKILQRQRKEALVYVALGFQFRNTGQTAATPPPINSCSPTVLSKTWEVEFTSQLLKWWGFSSIRAELRGVRQVGHIISQSHGWLNRSSAAIQEHGPVGPGSGPWWFISDWIKGRRGNRKHFPSYWLNPSWNSNPRSQQSSGKCFRQLRIHFFLIQEKAVVF